MCQDRSIPTLDLLILFSLSLSLSLSELPFSTRLSRKIEKERKKKHGKYIIQNKIYTQSE
jgi:hypothetical protein